VTFYVTLAILSCDKVARQNHRWRID